MSQPTAPVPRRLIALFIILVIAFGLFHWRAKDNYLPLWANSVAVLGLAGLLFSYALMVRDWKEREDYILSRLSGIEPLQPLAKSSALQAAQCRERATRLLHEGQIPVAGNIQAVESYILGLERGVDGRICELSGYPAGLPLHARWNRALLLKAHRQGYRHGSIIRRAFDT